MNFFVDDNTVMQFALALATGYRGEVSDLWDKAEALAFEGTRRKEAREQFQQVTQILQWVELHKQETEERSSSEFLQLAVKQWKRIRNDLDSELEPYARAGQHRLNMALRELGEEEV